MLCGSIGAVWMTACAHRHGLVAELDEHNAGVLIVSLDGQTTGQGRVMGADELTRGLERKDDGCTIM